MAEIRPFKGILYDEKKIDIRRVVAPPYDVISPSMQNRFYQMEKHNIVRLVLGKEIKGDTSRSNKYTRAALSLNAWLGNKILTKDKKPAIYIYVQEYIHAGKKRTRIGFIALMKIEDPKKSGILPHEYTLAKPKEDRLNLIKEARANLSPIFTLFHDSENKVNKILKGFIKSKNPFSIVEAEGVIHKLWRVENVAAIKKICLLMLKKKIFIADGHHRYEVALTYRDKMRKEKAGFKKSMDYVMMYFSSLSERGSLTVLSTHRVVNIIEHFNEKNILAGLGKYFDITRPGTLEDCMRCLEKSPRNKHVFGARMGRGYLLLTLKDTCSVDMLIDSAKTHSLKKLDVTILHDLIIDKILCVKNPESSIKYIRSERDAASVVDRGDYRIAFFLRPTSVVDMKRIAEGGEMMPQKSTYFYPKLLTGLVINKF